MNAAPKVLRVCEKCGRKLLTNGWTRLLEETLRDLRRSVKRRV